MATTIPVIVVDQTGTMEGRTPVTSDNPLPVTVVSGGGTGPSNANGNALVAQLLAKSAAGVLYGLSGYNTNGSDQFVQIHDSATTPANGAVPKVVFKVTASKNFSLDYGSVGRSFDNGIYICNSSTSSTKTVGAADCWFDAQYK